MSRSNRRYNTDFPEEREERTKDANKKLKSQIKILKKVIKQLESENRTLQRAFSKSCDFIQAKLKNHTLEQVLEVVEDFDYKETENGSKELFVEKKEKEKEKEKKENDNYENCPKCGKSKHEGFKMLDFEKFRVDACPCGYRLKVNFDEGIERN